LPKSSELERIMSLWSIEVNDVVDVKTYRNEIPYCDTMSKLDFHTSVTSQAFVADSLHDRKAETALPPTTPDTISFAHDRTSMRHGIEQACLRRRVEVQRT
jgi:hypothetical protein